MCLVLWCHVEKIFPFTFLSLKVQSWESALTTDHLLQITFEKFLGLMPEEKERNRDFLGAFVVPHLLPNVWRLWPRERSSCVLACCAQPVRRCGLLPLPLLSFCVFCSKLLRALSIYLSGSYNFFEVQKDDEICK